VLDDENSMWSALYNHFRAEQTHNSRNSGINMVTKDTKTSPVRNKIKEL
jgi:hypothetical protein